MGMIAMYFDQNIITPRQHSKTDETTPEPVLICSLV